MRYCHSEPARVEGGNVVEPRLMRGTTHVGMPPVILESKQHSHTEALAEISHHF